MKCIKKFIELKVFIIIPCLFQTLAISANAAGFIFSWQPFRADINLVLDNSDKEILIKNIPVVDINSHISEDFRDMDMFPAPVDRDKTLPQKSGKKFLPDAIKFTFHQPGSFMPDRFEKYSNSDDEQLSKMINAMTSLIYSDLKIKSLETIGGIIEPQVNFYFEF
ncbi:MAG: hypothetical protein APR62_05090 [Smithella sp. SDB]|nr:MAG: hypothetical protein APR62_05090 [Smithella sp. SDB]